MQPVPKSAGTQEATRRVVAVMITGWVHRTFINICKNTEIDDNELFILFFYVLRIFSHLKFGGAMISHRGPSPPGGAPIYYLSKYLPNLHKMKEIGPWGIQAHLHEIKGDVVILFDLVLKQLIQNLASISSSAVK